MMNIFLVFLFIYYAYGDVSLFQSGALIGIGGDAFSCHFYWSAERAINGSVIQETLSFELLNNGTVNETVPTWPPVLFGAGSGYIFSVDSLAGNGSALVLPPGESLDFEVQFFSDRAGEFAALGSLTAGASVALAITVYAPLLEIRAIDGFGAGNATYLASSTECLFPEPLEPLGNSLDFGTVVAREGGSTRFLELFNRGNSALLIDAISFSDGRFSVEGAAPTGWISPGAHVNFTIRFAGSAEDLAVRAEMFVDSSALPTRRVIPLLGVVIDHNARIVIDSDFVRPGGTYNAGELLAGSSLSLPVRVRNTGGAGDLDILSFVSTSPQFILANFSVTLPTVLASGGDVLLDLVLDTSLVGLQTGTLVLDSDDLDYPQYNVTVSMTVLAPQIRVSRRVGATNTELTSGQVLSFGTSVDVNVNDDVIFLVENTGDAPLSISTADLLPGGDAEFSIAAELTSTFLVPGAPALLVVRLFSSQRGLFNAVLEIDSDAYGASSAFHVNLTGEVVAPDLRVFDVFDDVFLADQDAVSFGTPFVYQEVLRVVTVSNVGTKALVFSRQPTVTGAGYGRADDLPALTIPPGGSGNFSLRLSTSVAGPRVGACALVSNDPVLPAFTIALDADLLFAEIELRADGVLLTDGGGPQVDFGQLVQYGEPVNVTFVAVNGGTGPLLLDPPAINISGDSSFSLVSGWSKTVVAAGGVDSAHFVVQFVSGTAHPLTGVNASLAFANNVIPPLADMSPFDVELVGRVVEPALRVALASDPLTGLGDGGMVTLLPSPAVGRNTSVEFIVENLGLGYLVVSDVSVNDSGGAGLFTIETPYVQGSETVFPWRFVVRFNAPALPGSYNGTLTLLTNDLNRTRVDLMLTVIVRAGELSLFFTAPPATGESVADGDTLAFDSFLQYNTTQSAFLNASNVGSHELSVGCLSVNSSGPLAFSLPDASALLLQPGESALVQVDFGAARELPGYFNATLSLCSSDPTGGEDFVVLPMVGRVVEPELRLFAVPTNGSVLQPVSISLPGAAVLDLGDVAVGSGSTLLEVVVGNSGLGLLTLADLRAEVSCGVGIDPSPFTISANFSGLMVQGLQGAGGSANSTFEVALTGRGDLEAGSYSCNASFSHNDLDLSSPLLLQLLGTFVGGEVDVFELQPAPSPLAPNSSVNFGSAVFSAPESRNFSVCNSGNAALSLLNISLLQPVGFELGAGGPLMPLTLPPGGCSPAFAVALNHPVRLDAASATVRVLTDDFNEAQFDFAVTGAVLAPELEVRVGSMGGAAVAADGSTVLSFPAIPVNFSQSQEFFVVNTGNYELELVPPTPVLAEDLGGRVVALPMPNVTLLPGTAAPFTAVMRSLEPRNVSRARLLVTSNDPVAPNRTWSMDVGFTGSQMFVIDTQGMQVVPHDTGRVHFGTTDWLVCVPRRLLVENVGRIDSLTLGTPRVVGPGAAFWSFNDTLTGLTLAPGEQAEISLLFCAELAGTYDADLELPSSDIDLPVYRVGLGAITVAPEILVAYFPSPIGNFSTSQMPPAGWVEVGDGSVVDFGGIPPHTSAGLRFLVLNLGTQDLLLTSVAAQGIGFQTPGLLQRLVVPVNTSVEFDVVMGAPNDMQNVTLSGALAVISNDFNETSIFVKLVGSVDPREELLPPPPLDADDEEDAVSSSVVPWLPVGVAVGTAVAVCCCCLLIVLLVVCLIVSIFACFICLLCLLIFLVLSVMTNVVQGVLGGKKAPRRDRSLAATSLSAASSSFSSSAGEEDESEGVENDDSSED